jgi:hypothetical protein
MENSNIIGIYTDVQYTYTLYSIKLKKILGFVFKYFVSIRKIHFDNSIWKVFLVHFYLNTSISILIFFQKYCWQTVFTVRHVGTHKFQCQFAVTCQI